MIIKSAKSRVDRQQECPQVASGCRTARQGCLVTHGRARPGWVEATNAHHGQQAGSRSTVGGAGESPARERRRMVLPWRALDADHRWGDPRHYAAVRSGRWPPRGSPGWRMVARVAGAVRRSAADIAAAQACGARGPWPTSAHRSQWPGSPTDWRSLVGAGARGAWAVAPRPRHALGAAFRAGSAVRRRSGGQCAGRAVRHWTSGVLSVRSRVGHGWHCPLVRGAAVRPIRRRWARLL